MKSFIDGKDQTLKQQIWISVERQCLGYASVKVNLKWFLNNLKFNRFLFMFVISFGKANELKCF